MNTYYKYQKYKSKYLNQKGGHDMRRTYDILALPYIQNKTQEEKEREFTNIKNLYISHTVKHVRNKL